jgi:hypothetical protein
MSALALALIDELDDAALDTLADRLAPRLTAATAGVTSMPKEGWMTARQTAEYIGLTLNALYKIDGCSADPF